LCESAVDLVERPSLCDQWREARDVSGENIAGLLPFVIRPADLKQRQLLAPPGVELYRSLQLGGDAGENNASGVARHLDRLPDGGSLRRAVENEVDSTVCGSAKIWRAASAALGFTRKSAPTRPAQPRRVGSGSNAPTRLWPD